ncbi:aldo/keto reductase [Rhodophyticola porphyridii]|uniref:Aldo/keto reductase n=1 Tax=Rhodophyticola porphyridii TaxID=1852017 RepID=A0A3L9YAP2_9RHOB|nr:aldo/keto reductase [Rhodophyticola porphyridii]RMA43333.1 aldo/keto reductase [Rhodophyticola porphyridii]
MKHIALGQSETRITDYCLGTMTWGNQTPEQDAHRQMDMALEAGINIVDTAEMYPVNPARAETVGRTEEILGNWLAANPHRRADLVIATKISGRNDSFVRIGQDITGETFLEAFEASLKRLKTDRIDLYQMHWPNRGSYHFRQIWDYDPSGQDKATTLAHMVDILEVADELVSAGKLGHLALSNDSAWGTAQWLRLSEERGLPRIASIQNEYSLLCRQYDSDLAELAVNENVTLLAFSPLGAGLLTGKYQHGAVPDGSRMSLVENLGGRKTDRAFEAVAVYQDIAARHGLDLIHMALAFTVSRPFPVSTIFGATNTDQLRHILNGLDVSLSKEVLAEINTAHRAIPMPY